MESWIELGPKAFLESLVESRSNDVPRHTIQRLEFLINVTILSLFTVSLPHLVDMDWRVDIKTSSDTISRMAVPTCLLQLKVLLFCVSLSVV